MQELRKVRGTVFSNFLGYRKNWEHGPYVFVVNGVGAGCSVANVQSAWDNQVCGQILTAVSRCLDISILEEVVSLMEALHSKCMLRVALCGGDGGVGSRAVVWDGEEVAAARQILLVLRLL